MRICFGIGGVLLAASCVLHAAGIPARVGSWLAGQNQYAIFIEPDAAQLELDGKAHFMASIGETVGFADYTTFMATDKYIRENKETLQNWTDGIAKGIDNGLVDFGVFAGEGKFYFLALLFRQVPDHTRKSLKYVSNGEHPDPHNCVLEFGRGLINHLCDSRKIPEKLLGAHEFFNIFRYLVEFCFMNDQLTRQVQEMVETFKIYP